MKTIRDEGADVGQVYGEMRQGDGPSFLSAYARAVSNGPLRFHTDRTDVVGLLCIDQASSGGLSKIASSVAVHNEILRRRPDLLEVLYRPYPRSRLGEEKGGGEMVYMLPIFGLCDGRFTSHYSRTYIEAAGYSPSPFGPLAERLRKDKSWMVASLPCGHDAMVDMPKEVAELLIAAA